MQGSSTIEAGDMETVSCEETICRNDKVCFDCKTSKTPLWRSGPAGPKSLCNACGIRYRKKKSVVGSSDKKREKLPPPQPQPQPPTLPPSPPPTPTSSSSSTTACNSISLKNRGIEDDGGDFEMKNGDLRKKMRIKVVALGKEVRLLQRPRSPMKKVRTRRMEREYKKFGEVERAAFLLMSLSCGSVFA